MTGFKVEVGAIEIAYLCYTVPMLTFKTTREMLVPQAVALVKRLRERGFTAYFAGGCVRDALRDALVKDIDIATSATPEEVAVCFPAQSIGVGKSFGVMLVVVEGIAYDVATFRTDGGYQDGRHPEFVTYDTAEHDAQRRDFTVNALFYDPIADQMIDFVGGVADLRAGRLRTVGEPRLRFQEDRLRMLRAVRFASVCGWQIEPATWAALKEEAPTLTSVSAERIRTEFLRMLCEAPRPSEALELLAESGLLQTFLPELLTLRGCLQDPIWHPEGDVWAHTVRMLDLLPAPRDPTLVWAVLFHDLGKPKTWVVDVKPDGSPWHRTPSHAAIGAAMVPPILQRLKESRETIELVTLVVSHHMQFVELPRMREATVRRMLGRPTMPLELELHRLDCLSSHAKLDLYELAQAKLAHYQAEPILPPPLITGKLLVTLGYCAGPKMGALLKQYYTRQLDGTPPGTLIEAAFLGAPKIASAPRRVAFVLAPGADFPLRSLWERLAENSAWACTLLILSGVPWAEPYNPKRHLVRLVGDCAGTVEWPRAGSYDVLLVAKGAQLPEAVQTLAPMVLLCV